MTGAAYACRAKPATAVVGGLDRDGSRPPAGRVDDSGGGLTDRGVGVDFYEIIILSCILQAWDADGRRFPPELRPSPRGAAPTTTGRVGSHWRDGIAEGTGAACVGKPIFRGETYGRPRPVSPRPRPAVNLPRAGRFALLRRRRGLNLGP